MAYCSFIYTFYLNNIYTLTTRVLATLLAICLSLSSTSLWAAPLREDQAASDFAVQLDTSALFEANKRGDVFALRVSSSRVLSLEFERVLTGADDARTWVGRVREGGSDNLVYLTEANGRVYATVPTSDSVFEIVAEPGEPAVVRDLAARGYQRKFSTARDFVVPPVLGAPVIVPARNLDQQKALPTPQVTVDLMIVYTAEFVTRYGANVASRLNNLIAQMNDAYLRSDVAITVRLVRSEQTSYTNSSSNNDALGALSGVNPNTGASMTPPPELSSVAATRNSVGADLVMLLRPFNNTAHVSCGVAYIGGYNQTSLVSAYGYSVASDGSDLGGSGYFCSDKTIPHELGHNMGLMHDRANSGTDTGAAPYGFGYIIPGTSPSVGDIMSYANQSVNCFSSPAVFRQGPGSGASGGTCGVTPTTGDVLGVAQSNSAASADAAAALNFTRVSVSNFRSAPTMIISGAISNSNNTAISGVTFCPRPSAGVTCSASSGSGAYTCTVPTGWAGILHSPSVSGNRIPAQTFPAVNVNTTRNVAGISGIPACNLDVDDNGLIEAETDGVAIMRRILGTAESGFSGLSGTCAANVTSAAIFNATSSNYNVTGGAATRPGTDGLVLLRAMRGLTGTAVTGGLGLTAEAGASNTTWASIRQNFLNTTCGANFLP